jgi:hypothetical protein
MYIYIYIYIYTIGNGDHPQNHLTPNGLSLEGSNFFRFSSVGFISAKQSPRPFLSKNFTLEAVLSPINVRGDPVEGDPCILYVHKFIHTYL